MLTTLSLILAAPLAQADTTTRSASAPEPTAVQQVEAPTREKRAETSSHRTVDASPTPSGPLLGRGLLAPTLGAVGFFPAAALGVLSGVALSPLIGSGAEGGGTPILVGFSVGWLGAAIGIAIGGSLFSDHFGALFRQTLPWAFLAALIPPLLFAATALLFHSALVSVLVMGVTALAGAVAVPLIVERRRISQALPAPEPALTVARF